MNISLSSQPKKILVGMSGGVDSAAAALLLQRSGHEVCGATLLLRPTEACADNHEARDAAAVCEALAIEHRCIDLRNLFRTRVMEYFAEEYKRGRTPNPCVECNRYIKFGAMLSLALDEGFDAVATGHYARIAVDEQGQPALFRSLSGKDQSYVLWQLSEFQLTKAILPLADMQKSDIREMVREAGLPVFSKPDSQDICFIPDGKYADFLQSFSDVRPNEGVFIDAEGHVIGRHNGTFNYTIGQRKGLGGGFAQPMFVTEIRPETNTVVLGVSGSQYRSCSVCRNVNMIHYPCDSHTFDAYVKARYSAQPAPAHIEVDAKNATALVSFFEPQRALTPGQSAVFYVGDRLIGGGIVDSVY